MPEIICQPGELDLLAIHHADPEAFPFLLESRVVNPVIGRYSLLLGDVSEQLQAFNSQEIDAIFARIGDSKAPPTPDHALPFVGGWLIYIAYEAAKHWNPALANMPDDGSALMRASYCNSAIIVDHLVQKTFFFDRKGNALRLQDTCLKTIAAVDSLPAATNAIGFEEEAPHQFESHVQRTIDYILAGDIYQANISRRWHGPTLDRAAFLPIYAALRQQNPASFAGSCLWPDFALASASPERLFRVANGVIDTRPIAGTRPRMESLTADLAKQQELKANPKEQAEHIMLVDLERNDLGRIAEPGTVKVDELLAIESYSSVHHLVSNISAKLRDNIGLGDILAAAFPGGTITGCPKIRCMQIIAELEQRPRGAYTGSLGYVSDCGHMDFNILIRTVVQKNGRLELDAGAGIVADSVPSRELNETRAKARGVLNALNPQS